MIILHSEHDKASRDFISKYSEGNTVLNYAECLSTYPFVSGFPSVVINVPAYSIPGEEYYDEETQTFGTSETINMEATVELMFNPTSLQEAINYQNMVNQRAIDNPPI